MGMRDDQKKRTKKLELGFNQAPRTDTDPVKVDVLRANNIVLSPDGSEAMPREGHVLYRRYSTQVTSPVGRKVIMIDRQPPGIGLTANMIISTKRNTIDNLLFTKEPTLADNQLSGGASTIFVTPPVLETFEHPYEGETMQSVTLDCYRTGDLSTSASFRLSVVSMENVITNIEDQLAALGAIQFGPGDAVPGSGEIDIDFTVEPKVPDVEGFAQIVLQADPLSFSSNALPDPSFNLIIINIHWFEI